GDLLRVQGAEHVLPQFGDGGGEPAPGERAGRADGVLHCLPRHEPADGRADEPIPGQPSAEPLVPRGPQQGGPGHSHPRPPRPAREPQPETRAALMSRGIVPSYSTRASASGTAKWPVNSSCAPPVKPSLVIGTPCSAASASSSDSLPSRPVATAPVAHYAHSA